MRFCVFCRKEISQAVLIKGRWKAIFCSPECRQLDRQAIRDARSHYRAEKGLCHTCGHKTSKPRNAREQTPAKPIAGLMEGAL